ncbi:hypothetical protein N9D31_01745 [Oligoflexaceae bacterium]|nr:hypothetical protein [Oligoflexaceae bacterium]
MNLDSDLSIKLKSRSLSQVKIDLIVCGSIAAVESVRFIRSLRRLGATVRVIMSAGAQNFVTKTPLEWASAGDVQVDFSGTTSHLGEADALVVAPASANFLSQAAAGGSDRAELALFQSYLGQKKPVMVLPCMHASLDASPLYQKAVSTIDSLVHWLAPRGEESKLKFPEPETLADEISHVIRRNESKVMLTTGGTRAAIDDVRYVGNRSTGRLGRLIAEELYRNGVETFVVQGPAEFTPQVSTLLIKIESVHEMLSACQKIADEQKISAGVFAAAVSDFEPTQATRGKIRSSEENLSIEMKSTPKVIAHFAKAKFLKVGFKLEPTDKDFAQIYKSYQKKYGLSAMLLNSLDGLSSGDDHKAHWFCGSSSKNLENKQQIAEAICEHVTSEAPQ